MCKILDLDLSRIKFLISLDRLCNDSNYFNVGNSIFKQVKGISMICYYSREISDLNLLYNYQLDSGKSSLKVFCRYIKFNKFRTLNFRTIYFRTV